MFQPLKKLATKIGAAMVAAKVSPELKADADTYFRKIKGVRAVPKPATTPQDPATPQTQTETLLPTEKTISTAQLSYDSVLEHYKKLVILLEEEPKYNPNEAELSTAGLNTLLTSLNEANTNVINANAYYKAGLINRNQLLYDSNGLVKRFEEVKNYVISVYGTRSSEAKQLTALQIKKNK